ncbi:hypothetical protein D1831_11960 [Lactiplantibacillus garii]|uniref:Uncharacterized protein n=1 Tax=Lactiplantibacillus garii TaxID=2306423 RepID=A0A426D4U2_9LACO|nr:hypothetical protein [Lactiplantibacillus garii]RRK09584.1 hypothetical protein D1831_11960 [Lactiplantibacillus garii]
MDISDWFDFSHRVQSETVLVKEVNGQVESKTVRGSFNWMAVLFNWIYVLATKQYRTPGFIQKFITIDIVGSVVCSAVYFLLGTFLGLVVSLAMYVWIGMMFDTWFKDQLLVNGYHVQSATATV